MNRTAYHRAYYHAHLERRRASARAARRKARERKVIIKIICDAVTEARNDKPRREAGLDGPGGMALRLNCCLSVMDILTDCSSHVKHPTTPINSGNLVGETTRRYALNPDRGSGPLDAQRIAGKREPHTGNREMLLAADGSVSHQIRTITLRRIPS